MTLPGAIAFIALYTLAIIATIRWLATLDARHDAPGDSANTQSNPDHGEVE